MTLLALVLALMAESLVSQEVLARLKAMNSRFTAELEIDLEALGAPRLAFLQWWVPVLLWVFGVYFLQDVIAPLGWPFVLAFNTVAVLYGLRFSQFSDMFTTTALFLSQGDFFRARERFLDWVAFYNHSLLQVRSPQDLVWMIVDHGIERALRQFFSLLFWFVMLPGPTGVALYIVVLWSVHREHLKWHTQELLSDQVSLAAHYQQDRIQALLSPRYALYLLEWIPARLLAITWIVLGYPDDYSTVWREARQHSPLSNKAPLTAVGFAAVGLKHANQAQTLPLAASTKRTKAEAPSDFQADLTDDAGWSDLLALTAFRNLVFRSAVVWYGVIAVFTLAQFTSG